MKSIVTYFVVFYLVFIFVSCKKEQKFSKIPEIKKIDFTESDIKRNIFDDLNQSYIDSLTVNIHFQDGDGDLGIANNDTSSSGSNYIMNVYAKRNGVFELLDFKLSFNGQFPSLSTDNVVGPIDGVLTRSISIQHLFPIKPKDTLRFDVKIFDRASNSSNTIITDEVVVYK